MRAGAVAAGLVAADEHNPFSGHSLRRGQITTALNDGAALEDVMHHARHRSPRSTLGYREVSEAEANQPVASIGPRETAGRSVVAESTDPGRSIKRW